MDVIAENMIFEKLAGRPSSHCATLTEAADGAVLAVWYAGSREGAADVALIAARYEQGRWSAPWVVLDTPGLPDGNPMLWTGPDGTLWLFHVIIHGHGWDSVLPYYRKSRDGGRTWTDCGLFEPREGLMFRCRPVTLRSGRVVLPAYDEQTWSGVCYLSDDDGQSWRPSQPLFAPPGCIQPAVVELAEGRLLAYLRTGGDGGCIWRSVSLDGGETWSACEDSGLPNPNSGIDLIQCVGERLVLAFNHQTKGRDRLAVGLSDDEGATWRQELVEDDPGNEYSYPALLQSRDGLVHLLYTHRRESIKHLILRC